MKEHWLLVHTDCNSQFRTTETMCNNQRRGYTNYPKIKVQPQNSRRQKGDMKQGPYWRLTAQNLLDRATWCLEFVQSWSHISSKEPRLWMTAAQWWIAPRDHSRRPSLIQHSRTETKFAGQILRVPCHIPNFTAIRPHVTSKLWFILFTFSI